MWIDSSDLFELDPVPTEFFENGQDRGAGASLLPHRIRVDLSLPTELHDWLSEKAFERGMVRAELIRKILRQTQRQQNDAKRLTIRHITEVG